MQLRLSCFYYLISNIWEGVGCLECFRFAQTVFQACNWISSCHRQTFAVKLSVQTIDSLTGLLFSAVVLQLPALDCSFVWGSWKISSRRTSTGRFQADRKITQKWGMWLKLRMKCCFISQREAVIGALSRPLMWVVTQTARRLAITQHWWGAMEFRHRWAAQKRQNILKTTTSKSTVNHSFSRFSYRVHLLV